MELRVLGPERENRDDFVNCRFKEEGSFVGAKRLVIANEVWQSRF